VSQAELSSNDAERPRAFERQAMMLWRRAITHVFSGDHPGHQPAPRCDASAPRYNGAHCRVRTLNALTASSIAAVCAPVDPKNVYLRRLK
jgi:hypothetical protein